MGVILIVRHGQASFGSADYDVLSEAGARQARCLGDALATRGVSPASVVCGSLRRQRETALALVKQAGWPLEPSIDAAWDEFGLSGLVADTPAGRGLGPEPGQEPRDRGAYQDALEVGMRRWAGPAGSPVAGESFTNFTERAESALRAAAAGHPQGTTTLVVTSGGVIGWIAASLLGAGVEQWIRLNRVCVNTGVTTVVTGRRGTSLIAFNDHSHLSPPEITYR